MSGKCCDNSSKYYTSDIIYDCEAFVCEGFPELSLKPCMNMCEVISIIMEALCDLKNSAGFQNVNIGGGAEVFKQEVGINQEFRTLTSTDGSVTITENADTIDFSASGGGSDCADVFKFIATPDGLQSTAVGCDDTLTFTVSGGIGISTTVDGTINIDGSGVAGSGEANTASNVGSGIGVFYQKTGVDLEFKSLVAGDGVTLDNVSDVEEIVISSTAGTSESCHEYVEDFTAVETKEPLPNFSHVISADGSYHVSVTLQVRVEPNDDTEVWLQKNGVPFGYKWVAARNTSAGGTQTDYPFHFEHCVEAISGDTINISTQAAGVGRGIGITYSTVFIQRIN